MIKGIIGMAIGSYIIAATIPGAIDTIETVNVTGWGAAEAAMFPLLGIIIVAGCVYSIGSEAGII